MPADPDVTALARATEKLTRHAFPITLEPLEPMEDEKVLSRDEARAVVDALALVERLQRERDEAKGIRTWRDDLKGKPDAR